MDSEHHFLAVYLATYVDLDAVDQATPLARSIAGWSQTN